MKLMLCVIVLYCVNVYCTPHTHTTNALFSFYLNHSCFQPVCSRRSSVVREGDQPADPAKSTLFAHVLCRVYCALFRLSCVHAGEALRNSCARKKKAEIVYFWCCRSSLSLNGVVVAPQKPSRLRHSVEMSCDIYEVLFAHCCSRNGPATPFFHQPQTNCL